MEFAVKLWQIDAYLFGLLHEHNSMKVYDIQMPTNTMLRLRSICRGFPLELLEESLLKIFPKMAQS